MERLKQVVHTMFNWVGLEVSRRREFQVPRDADPFDAETIAVVRSYTMTSPQRILALCEAIRYLVRCAVPGDVVECGVWRGGSMMAAARTLLHLGDRSRTLFLYDTFQGMSAPEDRDAQLDGTRAEEILAREQRDAESRFWCIASRDDVARVVLSTGYPASGVHLVEGKVEDTIPGVVPDHIALLRLDTDWYASTRHELEHLFPRVVRGGVVILDDYGHWRGAREAVDEFLQRTGARLLLHRIDYSGRIAVRSDG